MAHVDVVQTTGEQLPALARLYQLYAHDLSEFTGDCPDEDGLLPAPDLERYLDSPERRAYLFGVGEPRAGFALVNRWSPSGSGTDWQIAEFFVVRHYRRRGLGTDAARSVFARLPGIWEIGVLETNAPAIRFWTHAVSWPRCHDLQRLVGNGLRWSGPIFRFEVPP